VEIIALTILQVYKVVVSVFFIDFISKAS